MFWLLWKRKISHYGAVLEPMDHNLILSITTLQVMNNHNNLQNLKAERVRNEILGRGAKMEQLWSLGIILNIAYQIYKYQQNNHIGYHKYDINDQICRLCGQYPYHLI